MCGIERGDVNRKIWSIASAVCLVASLAGLAYDANNFLFLNEIEVGMLGTGKTIVADDIISEFDVEIIGVIDQPGDLSDFIVVRVSGVAIGQAGGVAQGMSGSPVYVGGKLIGALSRTGLWSKEIVPVALITPIEPMLAVLEASAVATAEPNPEAVLDGIQVAEGTTRPSAEALAASPDTVFSLPVSTPLIASGFSERATTILMDGFSVDAPLATIDRLLPNAVAPAADGLRQLGASLIPAAGDGATVDIDPQTLGPGSSLGVALVTGDLSIGALGTLTYREGDAVIGFGHRFLYNGPSDFPMTTVSIIDTMKSLEASYKLGALGQTVGAISEDRIAGIGGRIGSSFEGIAASYLVIDSDSTRSRDFSLEIVDEPRLMPNLLLSTGFEAVDSTLDRVGQGTVTMTYSIDGPGMPQSLERTDTFFSSTDIAVYPPLQLAAIVSLLQYNEFAAPELNAIEVEMAFTEEIRGVAISDLGIDYNIYAPGDTIHFRVALQEFQGELLEREGQIQIPEGLSANQLVVRAYGGPRYLESAEEPQVFTSLNDVIDAVESFPSYQTLTVELFAVDPYSLYEGGLYGIDEVTFEFPGRVVYGEREEDALYLGGPDWDTGG